MCTHLDQHCETKDDVKQKMMWNKRCVGGWVAGGKECFFPLIFIWLAVVYIINTEHLSVQTLIFFGVFLH